MSHSLAPCRAPLNGSTAARPVRALKAVGGDGLTKAERSALAARYAARTFSAPSPKTAGAIREWYARARAR